MEVDLSLKSPCGHEKEWPARQFLAEARGCESPDFESPSLADVTQEVFRCSSTGVSFSGGFHVIGNMLSFFHGANKQMEEFGPPLGLFRFEGATCLVGCKLTS